MKTKRLLAMLGVAIALAGCDHLRSQDANAHSQDEQKAKAPVNVMPGGDRYGGNAGTSQ